MRRVRRMLVHSITRASFLLFVGIAALCARSYWRSDSVHHYSESESAIASIVVNSQSARLQLGLTRFYQSTSAPIAYPIFFGKWQFRVEQSSGTGGWTMFGYFSNRSLQSGTWVETTSLTAPHWFVALLFIVPAFLRLIQTQRSKRRQPQGLICEHCGYDLRATPGRCPECERVAEALNAER